ncbi:MAG: HAD-IIB family hydrolase [Gammaproteobacteria bacterium]|jgi:sucrose-6F-phosphate phosphohydrolase
MSLSVLLCSDLDRTLLPNGQQPESPRARSCLRTAAQQAGLILTYVSGRHERLIRDAIQDYQIPIPHYAVGDVGTTIYQIRGNHWQPWREWSDAIAGDWAGAEHGDLTTLFEDLDILKLQETEKQNQFKLSYYTPTTFNRDNLITEMQNRLDNKGVKASLIWSVDEAAKVGLLDVLPASATKLHAVEFLMDRLQCPVSQTVFAGDSGNDLPVVTSGRVQAVLVKNAHPDVIREAESELARKNAMDKLYVAQGGLLGMNGNYAAGVLEGLVHFLPHTRDWLE